MKIKKIVMRNLKNAVKSVTDLSLNIALTPFTMGFAHASYLYFYITTPNGSDDKLERFLDSQRADFVAAENRILNRISEKIGLGPYEPETENKYPEYDKTAYNALLDIFDNVASYQEKKEAYGDGYDMLPSTAYMRAAILKHINAQDENIRYLWDKVKCEGIIVKGGIDYD